MTIGKFNYKKWIVENKYGKEPSHSNYQGSGLLNEQANTELITCYACYNDDAYTSQNEGSPLVSAEVIPSTNNYAGGFGGGVYANIDMTFIQDGGNFCGSYPSGPDGQLSFAATFNSLEALEASGLCSSSILDGGDDQFPATYVGCGVCNDDSNAPGAYACLPGIEITIEADQINYQQIATDNNGNPQEWDLAYLGNNEVIGGFESIGYGGNFAIGPNGTSQMNQSTALQYYCSSGSSAPVTDSNYAPFCCDINAMNFGQMANGQPYGTNPGEPEQYLMINGPQGDMCDNSICQGNVNQPDSIGDPPGPEGQGAPQPIATLGKDKITPPKSKAAPSRDRARRLKELSTAIINRMSTKGKGKTLPGNQSRLNKPKT